MASLPNGKQLNIQIPKNAKTGQQLRLKIRVFLRKIQGIYS